jgi:hypothetical protein
VDTSQLVFGVVLGLVQDQAEQNPNQPSKSQLVFGVMLVLVLLLLAGYYGWRQVQTLRSLPESEEFPDERQYVRRQAWRRLVGCVLMVLLACLFSGWFLFGIDDVANQLVQQGHDAVESGQKPELDADQKQAFRLVGWYSVGTLLVFLALVATAGLDVLAISRYRRRQFQKIRDDRRAMIERQAARLRTQRNGAG